MRLLFTAVVAFLVSGVAQAQSPPSTQLQQAMTACYKARVATNPAAFQTSWGECSQLIAAAPDYAANLFAHFDGEDANMQAQIHALVTRQIK